VLLRLSSFWADYRRVNPTFDPKDGFVPDTDLEGFFAGINFCDRVHNRHREANSLWMNLSFFDRTNGQRYHDDMSLGLWTSYRNGTSWGLNWSQSDRPPNVDDTWGVSLGWNGKKLHRGGRADVRWGHPAALTIIMYLLDWDFPYRLLLRLTFSVSCTNSSCCGSFSS